eukprot:g12501.t1
MGPHGRALRQVILLSLSKDGTYRSLLCDEDLKASLAGVGARDRPASHAAQPPRRASGVPVEARGFLCEAVAPRGIGGMKKT